MKNILKYLFFTSSAILIIATGIALKPADSIASHVVPEPLLIEAVSGTNPHIIGLADVFTDVLVYIDGKFAGLADVVGINSDTEYVFQYSHFHGYAPGAHKVYTVARDRGTLALSVQSEEREIVIPSIYTPIITGPTSATPTSNQKPRITGQAPPDSTVHIYIDGIHDGAVNTRSSFWPWVEFEYTPFNALNTGWHDVYAVAEARSGEKSLASKNSQFKIEPQLPAPTIKSISPSDNALRPVISGVAANGSKIKLFIDDKMIAEFWAKNSDSGTASFSYRLQYELSAGSHRIYVTAEDARGKDSGRSKIFTYNTSTKRPAITPEAVTEKSEPAAPVQKKSETDPKKMDSDADGLSDFDEINTYKTDPRSVDTDGDGYSDKTEIDSGHDPLKKPETKTEERPSIDTDGDGLSDQNEINIYGTDPDNSDTDGDGIDDKSEIDNGTNPLVKNDTGNGIATTANETEDEEGLTLSNRFKLNLAIFLVFLAGIIAWIIWVNREIIRERSKTGEKPKEEDKKEEPKSGENI